MNSETTIKIDGVPKPFVFTNHALEQVQNRTRIPNILEHLATRANQYEVTTGLSTNFAKRLESTTYLRHTGSNVILVLVHGPDAHVIVTGYTVADCAKRLQGKKWQTFKSYEWEFA